MKLRFLLPMLAMVLLSCGPSEPNGVFAETVPENSVTILLVCDGETTEEYWLSDPASAQELLDELRYTKATPVEITADMVEYPVYSFEIGSSDGWASDMAATGGYLLTADGRVYGFDFDFGRLLKQYPFQHERHYDGRRIACMQSLVLDENGWYAPLLSKAAEPTPPAGITLDVEKKSNTYYARFTNHGDAAWSFMAHLSVQVKLGETWYHVPKLPEHSITWELPETTIDPGDAWENSYTLDQYGDLPAGHYRLQVEGLTWEFTLE